MARVEFPLSVRSLKKTMNFVAVVGPVSRSYEKQLRFPNGDASSSLKTRDALNEPFAIFETRKTFVPAYTSLESRREQREAAWGRPGWDDVVAYTGKSNCSGHSGIFSFIWFQIQNRSGLDPNKYLAVSYNCREVIDLP